MSSQVEQFINFPQGNEFDDQPPPNIGWPSPSLILGLPPSLPLLRGGFFVLFNTYNYFKMSLTILVTSHSNPPLLNLIMQKNLTKILLT